MMRMMSLPLIATGLPLAGNPKASPVWVAVICQWIIAEISDRHVKMTDERLATAIAHLEIYSVRTIVEAVVETYLDSFRDHPGFVVLWFQSRVSDEIEAYVRAHDARLAERVHAMATAARLIKSDTPRGVFELTAEMIDAFLAVAYRHEIAGDRQIVAEGIEMIVRYLKPHATHDGLTGIAAANVAAPIRLQT
jgi:hypothetical protein